MNYSLLRNSPWKKELMTQLVSRLETSLEGGGHVYRQFLLVSFLMMFS